MKKLLTIILALAMLIPAAALADLPDVTGYSDQELKDLITAASAELMARNTVEPEGTLLFDYDGFCVYQTGDASLSNGYIVVPIILSNNRNVTTSIGIRETVCNGWVSGTYSSSDVPEKAKKRDEIRLNVKDAEVSSLEDISSLVFQWTATEGIMYVFKEDRTEHRFW